MREARTAENFDVLEVIAHSRSPSTYRRWRSSACIHHPGRIVPEEPIASVAIGIARAHVRQFPLVGIQIHRHRQADIPQIGPARGVLGLLPRLAQRRNQDRHQYGNDGNDDQQLNQGETIVFAHHRFLLPSYRGRCVWMFFVSADERPPRARRGLPPLLSSHLSSVGYPTHGHLFLHPNRLRPLWQEITSRPLLFRQKVRRSASSPRGGGRHRRPQSYLLTAEAGFLL